MNNEKEKGDETQPSGTSAPRESNATGRVSKTSTNQVYSVSLKVLDVMHRELNRLMNESKARCGLVIDRTGCILASAGDFAPIDPSTMGATAAATVAALNRMVSRSTSPEVSVKFYGSDLDKIHFFLLEERLVLCLLHSRSASTNAAIRGAAREFADTVEKALALSKDEETPDAKNVIESVSYIESKLDALFKDPESLEK